MRNREFLMLAKDFSNEVSIASWYVSEKLDGMRCFWDGGITRGMWCDQIDFANTEKHHVRIVRPKSTGLWSRYGHPIMAPDWWIASLPSIPLDGELYAGRGKFQYVMSACKKYSPDDSEWRSIRYHVFDSPHYESVFMDGRINQPNFRKTFADLDLAKWPHLGPGEFESVYRFLQCSIEPRHSVIEIVPQHQLHFAANQAEQEVQDLLLMITQQGGEGLILRHPTAGWEPYRSNRMLKVKKLYKESGVVVGYTWGRETDRGSKLRGMMGALIIRWRDKVFEISGFTDQERTLEYDNGSGSAAGAWEPGMQIVNPTIGNPMFPLGRTINFIYRELTDAGIPKEARYCRT